MSYLNNKDIINIIPNPKILIQLTGTVRLSTKIVLDKCCISEDYFSAKLLKQELMESTGICIGITKGDHQYQGAVYIKNKNIGLQGYSLSIDEGKIVLEGESSAGIFYGVQTLRQMIRQYKLNLPCVKIEDIPSLEYRGSYIDVTRGRVPTLRSLEEMVDRLSFYKINQMQLYFEHTFAFDGFGEIYSGRGSLCAEEILELDDYAYKRHVELVPSIATFGHLYEVLQSESFKEYCEFTDYKPKSRAWEERVRHHTIDISNKKAHEFTKRMIDEFYPLFKTNKFNICCDETFDLGKGKSKNLADEFGRDNLYIDYIIDLINHLKDREKQVMFWGDIIAKYPHLYKKLPDDVICLSWDYSKEPDKEKVKILQENQVLQYISPSIWSDSRIFNNYDVAIGNIINSAKIAKKYKALGYLNTNWGDMGHACHFENGFPLLALGAAVSWNFDQEVDVDEFFKALSQMEYGDCTGRLLNCVTRLSSAQVEWLWHRFTFAIDALIQNEQFKDLITEDGSFDKERFVADCKSYMETIEDIIKELENIRCLCPLNRKKNVNIIINAANGLKALHMTMFVLLGNVQDMAGQAAEFLESWLDVYCETWRADNKESELGNTIELLRSGSMYLRKFQKTGIGIKGI